MKQGHQRRWEEDRELVRRCLAGDESAWAQLVGRYERLVYSVARACGLLNQDADDVHQVVWERLIEHLAGLRRTEGLASWLTVTTRREAVRWATRRRREQALDEETLGLEPDGEESLEGTILRIEREHGVAIALERLGEPCRSLLEALYFEDPAPSYEELGARLGRPVGSLGPTRARCLEKLRRLVVRPPEAD